ncbi:MarR family transcriptional regulator [Blastococcus sp. MG754426]|nr:MarR family transcriptional regulator [Blastococcus sp. MG754426]MCF6513056.1 MarR family transcriptional regulator [Blastococcus sp. MG754427]
MAASPGDTGPDRGPRGATSPRTEGLPHPADLDAGRDSVRVHQRLTAELHRLGLSTTASRVLAYALADGRDRLTARDLAEGIGSSAAAISGAVQELVRLGLLQRDREPGVRSGYYRLGRPNPLPRYLASRLVLLERLEEALEAGFRELAPRDDRDRLLEARDFLSYLRASASRAIARWERSS